jgi:beta-lactamase class A
MPVALYWPAMPHRFAHKPALVASATTATLVVLLVLGYAVRFRLGDDGVTGSIPWSPDASALASGSAPDSHTPSPVAHTSTVDTTVAVRAAVAAYLASAGTHAALALYDTETGEQVLYNPSVRFETASIVKVDILATLLWQTQTKGARLSSAQQQLATAMITQSDNDAASELWRQIGAASGLAAANKVFGLTQTTPGSGSWGLTTTTAGDQLHLLRLLTTETGPLTKASQAYELGLMGRVEGDQRWGVPHAATPQATAVQVKNGWLSRSADGGRWIVNSVGRIVEPDHEWLVVVLSNHHTTESAGISMVEHAAALAVSGLRG